MPRCDSFTKRDSCQNIRGMPRLKSNARSVFAMYASVNRLLSRNATVRMAARTRFSIGNVGSGDIVEIGYVCGFLIQIFRTTVEFG